MCCIFESLALVKGDQKVKSRDAEEKKKLDRERASERERSWAIPECGSPKISQRRGEEGRTGHPEKEA